MVRTLEKAKADYKRYADRKHAPAWKVGDGAYLSSKNIRCLQTSCKLAPRFVGPFKVVELVNAVTVRLSLPKSLRKVHSVFHVSMLKKVPSPDQWHPDTPSPVPIEVEGEQHHEVRDILGSRGHRKKLQYLVDWKHFPKGEREWVDSDHLRAPKVVKRFHAKFPDKPSELSPGG